MSTKIQLKRGLEQDIPVLSEGEPAFTTDTWKLFIGSKNGNKQVFGGGGNVTPNTQSWVSTEGQDTFTISSGNITNNKSLIVFVGGIIQPNITLVSSKTFQLPVTINAGIEVYAIWFEVSVTSTPIGHHVTHELGGTDEIDITKLKNYDVITNEIGTSSNLLTTDKSNLVAAINENVAQLAQIVQVNVMSFGAKGDGTTDDTTAIQNAINSLSSGGVVFFPRGTYLISSTLLIGTKIRLVGIGKLLSIIKTNTSISAIKVNGTSGSSVYWWGIENLSLMGNNIGSIGLELSYAHDGFIKDSRIEGFIKGLTAIQSWSNGFHFNQILNNTDTNIELNNQSNDMVFTDCQFDGAGNYGIHITDDSQGVSFIGCVIQLCGKEAIRLEAGKTVNIVSCYFENNNQSNTASTPTVNAKGNIKQIQGLNINGSQFWDYNTNASILLDNVVGTSIIGSSFNPLSGGTITYTIQTTSNTFRVMFAGCYKEKPHNDIGSCITSFASGDSTNLKENFKVKKATPIISLDTPDATTGAYLQMAINGVQQTAFYTDVNGDLYLQHYNGSTMENILKVSSTNNMYPQKSIVMGGNKVYTAGFLGLQAVTAATSVNNSFFLDSADNVLKFKDNAGTVKIVNLT